MSDEGKAVLPNIVWWNGEIVPYENVKFGLLTHTLNYGTGLFEGIRAYWNEDHEQLYVFRMREHYERFVKNWTILKFRFSYTVEDLCEATIALLREAGHRQNVYIRPIGIIAAEKIGVYPGDFNPGLGIVALPFGAYIAGADRGLRVITTSWCRLKNSMIPPDGKICGAYVNSFLAAQEAREHGAHEAIFLTDDGHVSEGSGENIFLVQYGNLFRKIGMLADVKLLTPPPTDDILVGITRDSVMQVALGLGSIETVERSINRTELYKADEAFLTGTACEIAPIIEADGRKIGRGEVGAITAKIREAFGHAVKRKPLFVGNRITPEFWLRTLSEAWTTPVYSAID